MKKLTGTTLLSLLVVLLLVLGLTACAGFSTTPTKPKDDIPSLKFEQVYAYAQEAGYTGTLAELIEAFKGDNAYQIAVSKGYTGTETEWLMTLVGAKGNDGITPNIGTNGNWYIGTTDTGVKAQGPKGDNGKSAYETYKEYFDYEGTELQWILDLANGKLVAWSFKDLDSIREAIIKNFNVTLVGEFNDETITQKFSNEAWEVEAEDIVSICAYESGMRYLYYTDDNGNWFREPNSTYGNSPETLTLLFFNSQNYNYDQESNTYYAKESFLSSLKFLGGYLTECKITYKNGEIIVTATMEIGHETYIDPEINTLVYIFKDINRTVITLPTEFTDIDNTDTNGDGDTDEPEKPTVVAEGGKDNLQPLLDYAGNMLGSVLNYTLEMNIEGLLTNIDWLSYGLIYLYHEFDEGVAEHIILVLDDGQQPESGYISYTYDGIFHYAYTNTEGLFVRTQQTVSDLNYTIDMLNEILSELMALTTSADIVTYTIWSNGDLEFYMLHEQAEVTLIVTSVGTTAVTIPTNYING